MAINSKNKGNEFELKVAKLLGKWWDETFRRTPGSGGLGWRSDNRVTGDIVTPEGSLFPFSVEAKKHEKWDFSQFIKGTGEVDSWWDQCVRDSVTVDKEPLLVFSKNFAPTYFMINANVFGKILPKQEELQGMNLMVIYSDVYGPRVIGLLDQLIKFAPKDKILSILG